VRVGCRLIHPDVDMRELVAVLPLSRRLAEIGESLRLPAELGEERVFGGVSPFSAAFSVPAGHAQPGATGLRCASLRAPDSLTEASVLWPHPAAAIAARIAAEHKPAVAFICRDLPMSAANNAPGRWRGAAARDRDRRGATRAGRAGRRAVRAGRGSTPSFRVARARRARLRAAP